MKTLQTHNPTLAKEWHPTKNRNLTPRDVTPFSNKRVWWVCAKRKGHKWESTINNRSQGRGCPFCSGNKVSKDNCFQKIKPDLAKEWHPTKNRNLTPKDVTLFSNKRVWWVCAKRKGHKWETTINSRSQGHGCPFCYGNKVSEDNCLQTVNPDLAKEWHPTQNGNLTPRDVVTNSGKKFWWLCAKGKGHNWEASIYSRIHGDGCPYCSGRKKMISNTFISLKKE